MPSFFCMRRTAPQGSGSWTVARRIARKGMPAPTRVSHGGADGCWSCSHRRGQGWKRVAVGTGLGSSHRSDSCQLVEFSRGSMCRGDRVTKAACIMMTRLARGLSRPLRNVLLRATGFRGPIVPTAWTLEVTQNRACACLSLS